LKEVIIELKGEAVEIASLTKDKLIFETKLRKELKYLDIKPEQIDKKIS
jgi:hypothetical protein